MCPNVKTIRVRRFDRKAGVSRDLGQSVSPGAQSIDRGLRQKTSIYFSVSCADHSKCGKDAGVFKTLHDLS